MIPAVLIGQNQIEIENFILKISKKEKINSKNIYRIVSSDISLVWNIYKKLSSSLLLSGKKLLVLIDPDLKNHTSKMTILKLIESLNNSIILIIWLRDNSYFPDSLKSRCKIFFLKRAKKVSNFEKKELIISGSLSQLMNNYIVKNSAEAKEFCETLILLTKSKLNFKKNRFLGKILKEILETKNLLENHYLNPQHSIDHLLILIKKYANIFI